MKIGFQHWIVQILADCWGQQWLFIWFSSCLLMTCFEYISGIVSLRDISLLRRYNSNVMNPSILSIWLQGVYFYFGFLGQLIFLLREFDSKVSSSWYREQARCINDYMNLNISSEICWNFARHGCACSYDMCAFHKRDGLVVYDIGFLSLVNVFFMMYLLLF